MHEQDTPSGNLSIQLKLIFETADTDLTSADYIRLAQIIGTIERWERKNAPSTEEQLKIQGITH